MKCQEFLPHSLISKKIKKIEPEKDTWYTSFNLTFFCLKKKRMTIIEPHHGYRQAMSTLLLTSSEFMKNQIKIRQYNLDLVRRKKKGRETEYATFINWLWHVSKHCLDFAWNTRAYPSLLDDLIMDIIGAFFLEFRLLKCLLKNVCIC